MILTSPNGYADLLSDNNFVNFDFTSDRPVMTGRVGMLYGLPVMMTSNIGNNSATGYRNGSGAVAQPTPGVATASSPYYPSQQAIGLDNVTTVAPLGLPVNGGGSANGLPAGITNTTAPVQTSMVVHSDWLALAIQLTPKTESARQTEYLADLFVAHQLYGARVYRPDHAVLIHHLGV
jgi:hypothetical protein